MSLKPIHEIPAENIRNVGVPLAIDQIKEFFENKSLFFLVDYSQSKIKGNMFLTYLSNLDLPFEIILKDAPKQEVFDLIKTYMETRNQSTSDVLRLTVADILLTHKGVDTENWLQNRVLTKEDAKEFISQNLELIKKWDTFLSSTMVFLIKSFPALDEKLKVAEAFQHIKDPNYIGSNVVQLFSIPGFLELFFAAKYDGQLFYFDAQFDELMFKGKNLFHYFSCEENVFYGFIAGAGAGTITPEMVQNFMKAEA